MRNWQIRLSGSYQRDLDLEISYFTGINIMLEALFIEKVLKQNIFERMLYLNIIMLHKCYGPSSFVVNLMILIIMNFCHH